MAPDPRQLRSQRFPLHAAVETGDYVRVRGLLEGAMASQVNRRYETSGQTPLHIAASEASQEMIQLLLEAGAAVGRLDSCITTVMTALQMRRTVSSRRRSTTASPTPGRAWWRASSGRGQTSTSGG